MFNHRHLPVSGLLLLVLFFTLASVTLAQGPVTVQTANVPILGQIITDGNGKTLYMFQNDTPGVSNCNGNCAQTWPPFTASAGVTPTLASGVTGALSTLKRQDGTTQVQFNNMPLYFYAQDTAAGDTKGQGVGGNWWVINPASGPVRQTAAQATAAPGATAAAGATAVPAATAAGASAAAATPAVASPNALPTTGSGSAPGGLLSLLAAAILLLLAGWGMTRARRAR